MIEILEGIYYDSSKEWYEQPTELIELSREVEQTQPINIEFESTQVNGITQSRVIFSEWLHTTPKGQFSFRVEFNWLYPIQDSAFETKYKHDTIILNKIEDEHTT
jgi:hypothetical protein